MWQFNSTPNGDELMHRYHKYTQKYKKNGKWVYVYDRDSYRSDYDEKLKGLHNADKKVNQLNTMEKTMQKSLYPKQMKSYVNGVKEGKSIVDVAKKNDEKRAFIKENVKLRGNAEAARNREVMRKKRLESDIAKLKTENSNNNKNYNTYINSLSYKFSKVKSWINKNFG